MWANMSSCSGVIDAVGDLDPHHLVVAALALAVDAVVQAEDPEDVLVEVAGEVARELRLELLDVGAGCSGSISRCSMVLASGRGRGRPSAQNPTDPVKIPTTLANPESVGSTIPQAGRSAGSRGARPTRKARSSDWRPLRRGSHIVS